MLSFFECHFILLLIIIYNSVTCISQALVVIFVVNFVLVQVMLYFNFVFLRLTDYLLFSCTQAVAHDMSNNNVSFENKSFMIKSFFLSLSKPRFLFSYLWFENRLVFPMR